MDAGVTAKEARRYEIESSPRTSEPRHGSRLVAAVAVVGVIGIGANSASGVPAPAGHPQSREASHLPHHPSKLTRLSPTARPQLDRTGRKRFGKASIYAPMFAGRKMADGTRMRLTSNNAASRTLPLGTTARVTNLETGKTAVVTIHDRGPYVAGRIVDLSPSTARDIGLDRRTGVTRVVVAPIAIPMPDGNVKLGEGGPRRGTPKWQLADRGSNQSP